MKRNDAVIMEDLLDVECGLSPENLSCDGELSGSAIQRRHAELMRQKRALIVELGRTPTEQEIWSHPGRARL